MKEENTINAIVFELQLINKTENLKAAFAPIME